MEKELEHVYGNKVRVRACGLCWQGDDLLLINHQYLGSAHFWSPPGGGIELGLPASATLVKEFKEETGLIVTVGKYLFTCEFIKLPLHAIEVFFEIKAISGVLKTGSDPETNLAVISDANYKSFDFIRKLPTQQKHGIFTLAHSPSHLRNLSGYIEL